MFGYLYSTRIFINHSGSHILRREGTAVSWRPTWESPQGYQRSTEMCRYLGAFLFLTSRRILFLISRRIFVFDISAHADGKRRGPVPNLEGPESRDLIETVPDAATSAAPVVAPSAIRRRHAPKKNCGMGGETDWQAWRLRTWCRAQAPGNA